MAVLEKAKIQEVSADENETPQGDPLLVQFNPTSLKLKLTNTTAGNRSRAQQRTQHVGVGSTVLTLDLIFDTADEGTDKAPVSVRTKTRELEKYLLPKDDGSETPPRLQFEWDELVVAGIVESLNVDFDLFASNGAPLRAKVGLSIKSQEANYRLGSAGPGGRKSNEATSPTNSQSGATQPGGNTNNGAGQGGGNSDRSAPALDGESPAEFAARQGLDPAAWRGLDVDLGLDLDFKAGIEVGFNASLSISAGVGVSVGVKAGMDLSLEAAVGLDATANASSKASAGMSADNAAGFALSSAGGVAAAIETVKISKSETAAQQALAAFVPASSAGAPASVTPSPAASPAATPAAGATGAAAAPAVKSQRQQPRPPLAQSAPSGPGPRPTAVAAPPPPKADARSTGYGFGVPLRPLYKTVVTQQQAVICRRGDAASATGEPPFRQDVTTAPWLGLPQRDRARQVADRAEASRRRNPCRLVHDCDCKGGGK